MKTTKLLFLFTTVFVSLLILVDVVRADTVTGPYDYAIITEDKKYIFVMLVPDEEIMSSREYFGEEPTFQFGAQHRASSGKTFFLRDKYPCSGLYKNDGSIMPIWTVDWYDHVYLLEDEEHLIRWGPWHGKNTPFDDALAVAFYKNGIEVAKYFVDDLVKDKEAIKYSVSHYEWLEKQEFDKETRLLYIETVDHQAYTFDVRQMSESISEHRTDCKPNYRFSTLELHKQYLGLAISFAAFLAVVGSARFVDLVQKRRK